MARWSLARPFGTTTAPPHLSRRPEPLPASTAPSPATASRTLRLSSLTKPPKPPPPPPLLPRPKLPILTTSNDTPTNGKRDNSKKPPTDGTSSPSSSGADDVLRLMDALRVEPDEDVYISLLRDSANAAEVAAVHAHIAGKRAAFGLSLPLANRLLLAYASCGDRAAARKVFDEMPVKNGITWATMVSTYSDGCFHSEAIWLFTCMCHEARDLGGDCYDHAIVPVLRSCARVSEPRLGEQVHALVIKKNGVRGDISSSLLQLYCESSLHSRARRVLDMMRCSCEEPVPEAAWTSFITACHRDGLLDEAIDVFRDMVSSGVARSSFSLSSILAVCAESENQGCHGQQVHADAIKHGVDTNQFVMSGLVHMYAKQGQLADAARVFDTVGSQPDGVCWNTMALAYARSGWYREATRVMYRMKAAGVKPSELTINEVRLAYSR